MALQRGTPIDPRLQMLDVSPALQAGALELQSMVNLNESIQGAISNFQEKQEEKKMTKMRAQTIEKFLPNLGIAAGTEESKQVALTLAKDPQAIASMSDLISIGNKRQKMASEQDELENKKADDKLVLDAIAASTGTGGKVDKGSLENAYLQLGGNNLETLESLRGPGEIVVDQDTGVITQDGVFKGQVPQSALGKEPTEAENTEAKINAAKLEKLKLENQELRANLEGGGLVPQYATEADIPADFVGQAIVNGKLANIAAN
tara:strand:+ start:152 stop:937 length:786 start_codon:yes stop_codon:yes gene_type:complete